MIVIVLSLSGLRNAYKSVLSANGSFEISGASRWLDDISIAAAVTTPANITERNIFFFIYNLFKGFMLWHHCTSPWSSYIRKLCFECCIIFFYAGRIAKHLSQAGFIISVGDTNCTKYNTTYSLKFNSGYIIF